MFTSECLSVLLCLQILVYRSVTVFWEATFRESCYSNVAFQKAVIASNAEIFMNAQERGGAQNFMGSDSWRRIGLAASMIVIS